MNYITLLSTAVRFIDLHDSDREYGGAPSFTRETRSGKSDGVYLNIAILVLECLRKLDQNSHQEYMSFDSILNVVKIDRPDVDENDVLYVLNVLRRPSELFYLKPSPDASKLIRQSEKRKTAIVEKTESAGEYRLSQSGRLFFSLVNAARDAVYIRGDAYNLLHAIEGYDFPNIIAYSNEIVGRLRNEILDIRSALERIGRSESIDKYIGKFDQYRKVVDETILIVQKAERQLDNPETFEAFSNSDIDISFEGLCASVNRVRQVLIPFNRLISELVSTALHDRRNVAPPPQFLKAAIHFVKNPLSPNREDFLLNQWGAVGLDTPFHSALDGKAAVKIKPEPVKSQSMVFDGEQIESISRLGKLHFLDRHGAAIAEALSRAPLSLSEAIDNGWIMVDEHSFIGDLVGIFIAPDVLPVNGDIHIRISPSLNTKKVGDDDFLFNDIEIGITGGTNE
jgi:hypothetical protein